MVISTIFVSVMNRRSFVRDCSLLTWSCLVGGALLASCSTSAVIKARRDGDLLILPESELYDKAYIVVEHDDLEFPVYLTVQEGVHRAVSLECTHQGCELEPGRSVLVCPCHGSRFRPTGEVLSLPAKEPLKKYEVIVENGSVMIRIA